MLVSVIVVKLFIFVRACIGELQINILITIM